MYVCIKKVKNQNKLGRQIKIYSCMYKKGTNKNMLGRQIVNIIYLIFIW